MVTITDNEDYICVILFPIIPLLQGGGVPPNLSGSEVEPSFALISCWRERGRHMLSVRATKVQS